jgi:hypothetical protein
MPKTTKDLLLALADKIGGEEAERVRAAIQNKKLTGAVVDRPISDVEFEAQLSKMAQNLPKLLAKMKGPEWMKSAEWGLN